MLISSRRRPRIVHSVDNHAGFSFGRKLPGHRRTHEVHARLIDRCDIWLPRIDIRRQKEPRTKFALLMNVVDDLRMPDVLNLVDRQLSLDLRERIPVAIIVVPGVVMIELRWVRALSRSAERFVIPRLYYIDTVRIQRWNE